MCGRHTKNIRHNLTLSVMMTLCYRVYPRNETAKATRFGLTAIFRGRSNAVRGFTRPLHIRKQVTAKIWTK